MPRQNFIMRRLRTGAREWPPPRNMPNLFRSAAQAAARKTLGVYPKAPWIPFEAARALEAIVEPSWKVLEVGCGMSTVWLAERVAHVTTLEHNPVWRERILSRVGPNVDIRLKAHDPDEMSDFADIPDGSVELLFIDGGKRSLCLERGFQKVKPGGAIYLDNWDVRKFWQGSADFLAARNVSQRRFIDYIPGSINPTEGLLVRVSAQDTQRPSSRT